LLRGTSSGTRQRDSRHANENLRMRDAGRNGPRGTNDSAARDQPSRAGFRAGGRESHTHAAQTSGQHDPYTLFALFFFPSFFFFFFFFFEKPRTQIIPQRISVSLCSACVKRCRLLSSSALWRLHAAHSLHDPCPDAAFGVTTTSISSLNPPPRSRVTKALYEAHRVGGLFC